MFNARQQVAANIYKRLVIIDCPDNELRVLSICQPSPQIHFVAVYNGAIGNHPTTLVFDNDRITHTPR
jgi:hypothetical protein